MQIILANKSLQLNTQILQGQQIWGEVISLIPASYAVDFYTAVKQLLKFA